MKQRFTIHYRTEWGQQLQISIRHTAADGTERTGKVTMTTQDGDYWTAENTVVESRRSPVVAFTYAYEVTDGEGRVLRREWSHVPRTYACDASKNYRFDDQWHDLPLPAHLYSRAYAVTEGLPANDDVLPLALPLFRKTLLFRVSAPQLRGQQRVALVGSHPAVGSWNPARYVAMEPAGRHEWLLTLNADALMLPLEYKYVVIDDETHQIERWEEGDNRTVDGDISDGEVRVLYGDQLRMSEQPWRLAGVSVDVAALRSEQSCGVGDLGDLSRFIDWAASVEMRMVSVHLQPSTLHLPPSILHLLDLNTLGPLKDKRFMTTFRRRQRELNALATVDYDAVSRVKGDYVEAYCREHDVKVNTDDFVCQQLKEQMQRVSDRARSQGVALMVDGEWRMVDGDRWMEPFFDALSIDHVEEYFRKWVVPDDQVTDTMGHYEPALPLTAGEIEYFGLTFRREMLTRPVINDHVIERIFGMHAQYVRDTFLTRKAYGMYDLNGDVTTQRAVYQVFEGRNDENSLWIRDGLCQLVDNVLFVEDPQQKDMYHPRIRAFRTMAYEVLTAEERDAFMRIYNNFYYERHNMFWGQIGYERLSDLCRSTGMLLCAEDVGDMPPCVTPVLDALRILTLEVQQKPKQSGVEFAHLDANPVRSVAAVTTRHMSPLRLWWQEQPQRAQRYYTTMLQKQGRAPEQLPAHLAEEIIARHLYCPSMLCVLQLQDWLAMDSELRRKDPRQEYTPDDSDAGAAEQWRMHMTIDELMSAEMFNRKLRTMITRSKR